MARSKTTFKRGNKAAKGKGPNQTPAGKKRPGRPPNEAVLLLRDALNAPRTELGGRSCRDEAIRQLAIKLAQGDMNAVKLTLERTDPSALDVKHAHGGVISIEHVYPNDKRRLAGQDDDDPGFDPD